MISTRVLKWAQELDARWQRRQRPDRRVLVNSRTPMNYAVMAPIVRVMQNDPRVRFHFTASERPDQAREVYRELDSPAQLITPRRAALAKFDAYLVADLLWVSLPRGTRRVLMFHGVAGKYGSVYDTPDRSMRDWDRLFFINRRRMQNFATSGAIDADSPAARLVGYPKLDCLVDGSFDRDTLLSRFGLDPQKRSVLYAPTWSPYSSLNAVGEELVRALCKQGYSVIVKLHDRSFEPEYIHSGGIDWAAQLEPILRSGDGLLARSSDACPYLAAADLLITDHSSVGFEYLLLNRPVVRIEMPGLLSATNVHPDYVALLAEASTSVRNLADALIAVERGLCEPQLRSEARRAVAEELFYDPGNATRRAVRELYEVLQLDPPPADVPDTDAECSSSNEFRTKRELDAAGTAGSVHKLFEAQASRTPDAVALTFEDSKFTYRELNACANKVAHYLIRLGVGPETLVGISLERSMEMIVALLATLKAGGAYVPLDPTYPLDRLAFMIEDSGVSVLLTEQRLVERLPQFSGRLACLDTGWESITREPEGNPTTQTGPDNLAYVIYTSGSTGRPKGVAIEHRSLLNYVATAIKAYEIEPADRVLQFASINFDASAEEIYPCLARGATLVLRTDAMLGSVSDFIETCRVWGITVLDLPTAYWHELTVALAADDLAIPASVRLVIIGGEKALTDRLARWRRAEGKDVRLVNTYGPTEATIVATMCDLTEAHLAGEVPIGRPIPNVEIYILDPHDRQVPVGVTGELHIGGAGLARGYLNRPDLTSEKFIADPFSSNPLARLYRTGDLARYLPDGNIEYVGRMDNQVKVNGFRIELGEIESALRAHPDIGDCVVDAPEDSHGHKRLVAYVVPEDPNDNGLAYHELRRFLSAKLPFHMLPSAFVVIDALPLSPNGKVDRRALRRPDNQRSIHTNGYVKPRDPLEYELVHIWEDLLNLRQVGIRVGIRDDFFELGGDSLLAVRMFGQIEQAFGKKLPLSTLFDGTTIEHLADALLATSAEKVGSRLVGIKNGGRRKPFFFLPGDFNGGGLYCLNMARHLSSDQPFYALQPHGLDDQPVPPTIEQMAADHIDTLRTFKREGPYLLGGFCNGAFIAFEMAKQLIAQGQQVDLLVLILASASNARFRWLDNFNRVTSRVRGLEPSAQLDRFVRLRERIVSLKEIKQNRASRFRDLSQMKPDKQMEFVRAKIAEQVGRLRRANRNGKDRSNGCRVSVSARSPGESRREALLEVYDRAVAGYVPRRYSGRIALLWPEEEPSETPGDPTMGWGALAPEVDVHMVPGRHLTSITNHIDTLASCLDDVLRSVK